MIVSHTLNDAPLPTGSTCIALGLFDGMHRGHQAVLDSALAGSSIRGLEPCVFTFSMPGGRPGGKLGMARLMTEELTTRLLRRAGFARVICPPFEEFRDLSPADFTRLLRDKLGAARIVCGYNFRFGKGAVGGSEELVRLCDGLGIETDVIPSVEQEGEPVSSSRIRVLAAQGDIPAANAMLGRCFAIDFPVAVGRRLGRTLGWPTINQPFPEDFTLPRYGVYATLTTVDGNRFSSVTNVGVKPTVGSERALAETYIQNFNGNLYDRRVLVEFLRFLRPERKFASVDELRAQISRDVAECLSLTAPPLFPAKGNDPL